jgi:hypothetical protein
VKLPVAVNAKDACDFALSNRYTYSVMNSKFNGGETANALLGIVFHAVLCVFGGLALGFVIGVGVGGFWRGASRNIQALAEFLPLVVSSALLALFATSRWFSRSAPWVGLLGLASLFIGGLELWRGWSPTWSYQTRSNYVLSQLFGVPSSCGDSECLYMLLFSGPFVCLTAYSLAALIKLRFMRRQLA